MKIEKRIADKKRNIMQITTVDERWYQKEDKFVPSVTWITSHYPKGIQFYKWLASKGWDEADTIKKEAGDRGSKIHNAISDLISGKEIKIEDSYYNETKDKNEELTASEWEAIISFVDWYKSQKNIKVIANETVTFSDKYNYAGTVDLLCEIDGESWVIDFKSGQNIWPEGEAQLSAYKHSLIEEGRIKDARIAILQVGYNRNKNKYKFTEIEDRFDLFLSARNFWEKECANIVPHQKDFPITIKL